MELLEPGCCHQPAPPVAGDAAAFVLSRLPHPDTAAADGAAFVDAATGASLSFGALRRAALSLASGLRLGLGLRRGDAVLILSPNNSLLLPQVILGVLAAGGVAVVAATDPVDATAAEISAAAHGSGAVMIVAAPEVAGKAAGVGVPLLLTSRSPDPRTLSAEELIDGADPTALAAPEVAPRPSDVAFVAYSSASKTVAMTHADLIAAAASGLSDDESRVCLASLPMCSVHGLPLLAIGLPAAGVTTVLMPPPSDPRAARDAVAAHGATDVVAAPEAAAVLAAPMPQDGKLSSLRRVIVAPATLAAEARLEFRRRLPWVELTEMYDSPEDETVRASKEVQMAPAQLGPPVRTQTDAAAVIQNNSQTADQITVTRETAATSVPPLKKMQKIILGDIFSRLNTSKNLRRKEPDTCTRQAVSKL